MSCERVREQIPELLAGHLDAPARERLVEHLEGCAGCRSEVAELNAVWRVMESLKNENREAPDPSAKARFLEVLDAYRAGMGVAAAQPAKRRAWFGVHPVWQAAMAAALVIGGIFAGRYATEPKMENPEVAQLKGQVESLRQMVALSMLQQQSPSARMRGVSYTEEMTQPDRQVQQALLFAVNHDTNVNVRLSAVDALQKYAGDPEVVRAMVDAIPVQDSPLVQIALIDMLVQVNARSARPFMVRLAQDTQAQDVVRQRAGWALEKLGGTR
jgi:HEAT repeats/Putative zinc-finger